MEAVDSWRPSDYHAMGYAMLASRSIRRAFDRQAADRLLVAANRELAEAYIRDQNLTLTEISFLLGFGDTSSFSRAFKRWTGQPPSAQRQQLA